VLNLDDKYLVVKRFVKRKSILLVTGICICDVHSVIKFFWPQTQDINYNLFLSPKYHDSQNVLWYMFELGNILNKIIWCYILASCGLLIASFGFPVARKLFWIGLIFFGYQITQFCFYIWNRNTSFHSNIMVYCAILAGVVEIVWPDKKNGIIKRME
jgi:hypothetical protein